MPALIMKQIFLKIQVEKMLINLLISRQEDIQVRNTKFYSYSIPVSLNFPAFFDIIKSKKVLFRQPGINCGQLITSNLFHLKF